MITTVSSQPTAPSKASKRTRRNGIRKHGSGFQARAQVNGESLTKTFPTQKEADLWLQLKRGELIVHAGGGYGKTSQMSVADLLREYADKGISDHRGASQEVSRLHCLAGHEWSEKPLLELLPADIDALMDEFKTAGPSGRPLKDDTRRLYFSAISSSYDYAIRKLRWHFLANPCSAATRPPPGKGRTRVLTADEEERIVARLHASPSPYYVYAVLLLIATTVRVGELFGMRWQDVDLENRVIHLRKDKANGFIGRDVPLSLEGVALLETIPRKDERVMPVERSAFVSLWNQLRVDLDIDNLRLQDLRHDGATRWGKRLRNLALLQKVTGHKTLTMVQRYLNVPLQDAIDAMDAAQADDPYLQGRPRLAPKPRHSLAQHIPLLPVPPSTPAPPSVPSGNVVQFPGQRLGKSPDGKASARAVTAACTDIKAG